MYVKCTYNNSVVCYQNYLSLMDKTWTHRHCMAHQCCFHRYYFENTVPLWSNFYNDIWLHIEEFVSRRLLRGSNTHLISTGTYQIFNLPDVNNVSVPLYLKYPNRIPVPQFIWKLDYEAGGLTAPRVIIGFNSPSYQKDYPEDSPLFICDVIECPNVVQSILRGANYGLVYCCTKKSFEKTYGLFRPIMFHKNLI